MSMLGGPFRPKERKTYGKIDLTPIKQETRFSVFKEETIQKYNEATTKEKFKPFIGILKQLEDHYKELEAKQQSQPSIILTAEELRTIRNNWSSKKEHEYSSRRRL